MSYSLLSDTTPTARKKHRCIWCGEAIEIGEKYRRERSVYDGLIQDHAWHTECDDDCRKINGNGEFEIDAWENERPKTHES